MQTKRNGPQQRTLAALTLLLAIFALQQSGLSAEAPVRYPRDQFIDVTKLTLDLEVDLDKRSIAGSATIRARAVVVPLREIILDAVDLNIRAVTDLSGRNLQFASAETNLSITLPKPVTATGAPLGLKVYYSAKPKRGLHWFAPTQTDSTVQRQLWSQNESIDARHWIPCIDTPDERQSTEVIVRVDREYTVISNGTLVSKTQLGATANQRTWHYRQVEEHPIYLVTLVVGRLHTEEDRWGQLPLAYHVPIDRAADVERTFGTTKSMLSFFTKRLKQPFPWPKYEQVVVEQFSHGGMENSGATTLNERTLHSARAHLDHSSDPLIAHELAHQWFGNVVTCRDWTHIWLNEGFATFLEACWDEERNGQDAYAWNMLGKQGGALAGGKNTPLIRRRYNTPGETFGGGTYPKGAWILHMLRRDLGEAVFWQGMQSYLSTYTGKAAETADFRRSMEAASGRSLGLFFDQWVEQPGHPELKVAVSWNEASEVLECVVEQTQAAGVFRIPFDLRLAHGSGGPEKAIRYSLIQRQHRFVIPSPSRPLWLAVDPNQRVLKQLSLKMPQWLAVATLREAPHAMARYEAARSLHENRSQAAEQALVAAAASDRSVAVRVEAVRALASRDNAQTLLLGLLEQLGEPKPHGSDTDEGWSARRDNARVRLELVGSLTRWHRDTDVREAMGRLIACPHVSVRVEIDALRALARWPRAQDLAIFEARLLGSETEQSIALSAVMGLENMAVAVSLERLVELARPGTTRPAIRMAAMRAMATVAASRGCLPQRREAVVEQLTIALEEKSGRFRRAALDALRKLGTHAAEADRVVAVLADSDPVESIRSNARAVRAQLSRGAPADKELEVLKKMLADNEARTKDLTKRLERLESGTNEGKSGAF